MNTELLSKAFENFMKDSFHQAAISSTKASWGGSEYCVELFDDGTYRVLWSGNIGNAYESTGVILGIPSLDDEEWDGTEENEEDAYYGYAEELMKDKFADYLADSASW
jgi:hypothetical protein